MRKLAGLCMMFCVVSLVSAQVKDKDTKGTKDTPKVKATLVKADVVKKTLAVKIADKASTLAVGKDVKFIGPKGGVSEDGIEDKRLTPGVVLGLIMDGKMLKEVHIPTITKAKSDKDKVKAKDK